MIYQNRFKISPTKMRFYGARSYLWAKGNPVLTVYAVATDYCASGLMFRVVGLNKKPRWFDSGYFKKRALFPPAD